MVRLRAKQELEMPLLDLKRMGIWSKRIELDGNPGSSWYQTIVYKESSVLAHQHLKLPFYHHCSLETKLSHLTSVCLDHFSWAKSFLLSTLSRGIHHPRGAQGQALRGRGEAKVRQGPEGDGPCDKSLPCRALTSAMINMLIYQEYTSINYHSVDGLLIVKVRTVVENLMATVCILQYNTVVIFSIIIYHSNI